MRKILKISLIHTKNTVDNKILGKSDKLGGVKYSTRLSGTRLNWIGKDQNSVMNWLQKILSFQLGVTQQFGRQNPNSLEDKIPTGINDDAKTLKIPKYMG